MVGLYKLRSCFCKKKKKKKKNSKNKNEKMPSHMLEIKKKKALFSDEIELSVVLSCFIGWTFHRLFSKMENCPNLKVNILPNNDKLC